MRRQVVCLCGSGRFWSEILDVAASLTLKGCIVLQPNFNTKQPSPNCTTTEEKKRLDLLHLDKIRMADEVLIVCPDGYVGESTAFELFFAKRLRKLVSFTHAREFAAQAGVAARREFLRAVDKRCCVDLLLDPVPKFDDLIDQLIAECSRAPIPQSLVSRAQAAVPHARRLAESMHAETMELREALVLTLDLLEHAWGVIANAPAPGRGGDSKEWAWGGGDPEEWVSIAQKWRDDYLAVIKPDHPVMALTDSLRKQRALKRQIEQIIEMVRSRPTSCRDLVHDVQVHLAGLAPLLSAWPGGVNDGQAEPAEG